MKSVLATSPHRRSGKRFAALVGVVVFLVLAGTSSATAYWTSAAQNISGTATSTSVSTTMTGINGLDTTWSFNGASSNSPIKYTTIPVTNTGGAPLTYTLAITNTNSTLAGLTKLWIWKSLGACTAIPGGTPQILLSTATPTLPTGTTNLTAGASYTLCAATQLNSTITASGGQSVTATFTLTGQISTNWVATAAGATTEAVAPITPLTNAVCTSGGGISGYGVTISWNAVSVPAGNTVTYFITGNGSPTAVWSGSGGSGSTRSQVVYKGTIGYTPAYNGADTLYLQARITSGPLTGGSTAIASFPIDDSGVSLTC